MKPLTTFLCCLLAGAAFAQMSIPSRVVIAPKYNTHYVSAQGWDKGTNYSAHCNEINSTNRQFDIGWTPSPTPGTVTVIESGYSPGVYTQTNCVGTNSTTHFPVPAPPAPWFLEFGGNVVIDYTNATMPSQFFQAYEDTGGDQFSISDSTNCNGPWNSAFVILPIGDGTGFQFTQTP